MPKHFPRRTFLTATSGVIATQLVHARPLRAAALERCNVAVIGLGSRGTQVMREFLEQPQVQVVAVCDAHDLHYRDNAWGKGQQLGREPARQLVDQFYAEQSKSGAARVCTAYADYRQVLERSDLDAVVVATPDHWHARITLDALRSGRDVYCEKPMTHFFAEGQAVVQEVAKRQAILQVGSQQRSDRLFRGAVEIVRNGLLGKLTRVEVGLPKGYAEAQDDITPSQPPAGLDYDQWCGPAPLLPYMRARHHRWWRSTCAFGGGVLMDWIGHHNDIAHWSLDQDRGGPTRVEAVGWTQSACPLYDTPVEYEIRCTYPGELELAISTQVEQGTRWIGEAGWLWVNRGKIRSSNPEWLEDDFSPGAWTADRSDDHVANFVECVQSRTPCVTSAETGHRSITPGHLGYVSHTLGRVLAWDSRLETVIDDSQAQALLMAAPYRQPWTLD